MTTDTLEILDCGHPRTFLALVAPTVRATLQTV